MLVKDARRSSITIKVDDVNVETDKELLKLKKIVATPGVVPPRREIGNNVQSFIYLHYLILYFMLQKWLENFIATKLDLRMNSRVLDLFNKPNYFRGKQTVKFVMVPA